MSHLEQSVRRKAGADRTGHWFRAISESEPDVTYLKTAAADLSRTCEATECQHSDSDETLFIHNLQSVADFVRAAQVRDLDLFWLTWLHVSNLYASELDTF